ncbi:hypothetical protein FB451DRAFT_1142308 [Mycena latifolia]|nr:hypothetical protein FB451DRAFT_1142308 [Mycena latifolia]
MAAHPSLTELSGYTAIAASTTRDIGAAINSPFMTLAASLTVAILTSIEFLKVFKEECIQMMEQIHEILCAIITLHSMAIDGQLPLQFEIAKFTHTLQKINTFIASQQRMGKLKQLFRKFDTAMQIEACKSELRESLEIFRTQAAVAIMGRMAYEQKDAETRHKELLVLLEGCPELVNSDQATSVAGTVSSFGTSSISLSMLPAPPQIFHGRDSELDRILRVLSQESARIAILGAGGIGKTSLATMALHHTDVAAKYSERYFVQCHSVLTCVDLISTLASHLGLGKSANLLGNIIQHFSQGSTLLVFDNFETPWEHSGSRSEIEDFLSQLSAISSLAIMITMRGAERPAKVRWTHPFLMPLQPLTNSAALQIFIDIADDHHEEAFIKQLLDLSGNLPLAITLLGHVVAHEGCERTLARWNEERTHLLSDGYDKKSSLDISIMLSVSSPRMNQKAQDLLSILAMLPDGLSDADLIQSQIPIPDILAAKVVLVRTALAYTTDEQRVKVLVPVREYVSSTLPASDALKFAIRQHFHRVLTLWDRNILADGVAVQISRNFGNLNSILQDALRSSCPDTLDNVKSVIILTRFSQISGRASSRLMDQVSQQIGNWQHDPIYGRYLVEKFKSALFFPIDDPDSYIAIGNQYFEDKPQIEKGQWFNALGHFFGHKNQTKKALDYHFQALSLVETSGVPNFEELAALRGLAEIFSRTGQYVAGKANAYKAEQYAELLGDVVAQAQCAGIRARCYYSLGDFRQALDLVKKAKALWASCRITDPSTSLDEAEIHLLKTEYTDSRRINAELAGDPSANQPPSWFSAIAHLNLAQIDLAIQGDPATIRRSLQSAIGQFQSLKYSRGALACGKASAYLALYDGEISHAKSMFETSFSQLAQVTPDDATFCLEKLVDINCRLGDTRNSSRWATIYLALGVKLENQLETLKALRRMGDIFVSEGDDDTALKVFHVALEGFTLMDVHQSRGDCMVRLAKVLERRGNMQGAVDFWIAARPLFEKSSQWKDLEEVDAKVAKFHVQ